MKNSLIGKKIRGTNAYGQAVGKIGTVVDANTELADKYGNYPIIIEYEDGKRKQSMSFWVKVVEE